MLDACWQVDELHIGGGEALQRVDHLALLLARGTGAVPAGRHGFDGRGDQVDPARIAHSGSQGHVVDGCPPGLTRSGAWHSAVM